MGVKTLLVLFVATLTQAALGLKLEEFRPYDADPRNDWPCPEEPDIAPCKCTRIDQDLELDCSAVADDSQLQSVFKAHFPFNNFTLLTIISNPEEKRVPINFLSNGIFQNVTFNNIRISHTELSFIYPDVFDKSAPFLETLIVTDNFITIFPFDVVDKAPFLSDLRVFRNEIIHMPEMTSDTLNYLHVAYNPALQFGDHAFEQLPKLEYFVANDIGLKHVAANAFIKNTKLKYLDLSYNNLETLYKNSLNFQSPIEEIKLNSNRIHTVEVGAISGLGTGTKTFLWLHNNQIQSLDQNVWEPVFNSVTGKTRNFVFDNNPFECQCNILWLVSNDEHRNTIARGSFCVDTETDILDVDVDFLTENCV